MSVKAEIQEPGFATRRNCVLCEEWTEKEVILTALTEGNTGWVCDKCVMVGSGEAVKRAIDNWEEMKRLAEANLAELYRIRNGEGTLELPTPEALEAARQAHEWYGQDYKLAGSALQNSSE